MRVYKSGLWKRWRRMGSGIAGDDAGNDAGGGVGGCGSFQQDVVLALR